MPYRTIEVLKVGDYRLPDGRLFRSTPDKNRRICEQANRQLSVGLRQPASWMHDPNADPVYLSGGATNADAWLARGYFGEAHKFTTDARGNMWAKVWIHRDQDADQFDLVRQVSPGLYAGWVDEKGVRWPEMTVLHIAATPKPIQRHIGQGDPPTFLGQPARRPGLIHLSFTVTPRSAPMAVEKEEMEVTETDGGVNLTPDQIAKIVEMCAKHGLKLAGDIQDAKHLLIAMESASNTLTGEEGMDDEMDEMGDEMGDGNMNEAPPPVLMSQLVAKVAKLETRLATYEVKERNDLLDKLVKSGRITKPSYDKRKKELNAINLSQPAAPLFSKDGKFKAGDLDMFIAVARELPAGPLSKQGQIDLSVRVVEPAKPETDEDNEARLKRQAAEDAAKVNQSRR